MLKLGLVIKPEFHMLRKSVCALTPYLTEALLRSFDTTLVYDQATYRKSRNVVDFYISLEPKWAAPVLRWGRGFFTSRAAQPVYVLMSDPHIEQWREAYFHNQKLDFILAYYWAPFRNHFHRTSEDRIIHFPWAMPDQWMQAVVYEQEHRDQDFVAIFGATSGDAYNLRRWCREQPHVRSFAYSGVENKLLDDVDYFEWLKSFDAAIAAGSDSPVYQLTTPKYFEIAAAGCLLFGQETPDLERLGFRHEENCLVFQTDTFNDLVRT